MSAEELSYFGEHEPEEIFGHRVRRVQKTDGKLAYECQDCDLVSNSVTAFDQFACEEGSDDAE